MKPGLTHRSFGPGRAPVRLAISAALGLALGALAGCGQNGAGSSVAGTPAVTLSPTALSFPQTLTGSSSTQKLMIRNDGAARLTITSLNLSGTNAASFSVGQNGCSGALEAGASCEASIVYGPHLANNGESAKLVLTDDAGGKAGSTQEVALSGAALAAINSIDNFGASIACGFYAEPHDEVAPLYSSNGVSSLFDRFVGAPAQNHCYPGDMGADFSRQRAVASTTPAIDGNQLYTVLVGSNDAARCSSEACLNTYIQTVGAGLAWLALPSSDKVLARSIVQRTGTWSADAEIGLTSTSAGASLSFTVNQAVGGRNLYLVYHVYAEPYGQAGAAAVSIDGSPQGTLEESKESGFSSETHNGTSDTFFVKTFPLGAVGTHTITFTSTGPAGSRTGLLWAGVARQTYLPGDGAPRVLVGAITNSPNTSIDDAVTLYNARLRTLVNGLVQDGMDAILVPSDTVLDPKTDFSDNLHPNTAGHAKLAGVFERFR